MKDLLTLVIASSNPGKTAEIRDLLTDSPICIKNLDDFGPIPPVVEDGETFEENAYKKASFVSRVLGLPALADDSGLVVEALDGAPGVYSARYAGENASDQDNNNKMLEELEGVPEEERTARYQCLIVFMRDHTDPVPIITQGSWEGRILQAPSGEGGFGYDPIFYVPTHECSGGELPLEVKNTISHRAIALNAMLEEFRKHHYI